MATREWSDTDRKSVSGVTLPNIPGLSKSPASRVVWAMGVGATVLWGDGETTWMDTSEWLGWGVSRRSMTAEPAEGKQEGPGNVVEKGPTLENFYAMKTNRKISSIEDRQQVKTVKKNSTLSPLFTASLQGKTVGSVTLLETKAMKAGEGLAMGTNV